MSRDQAVAMDFLGVEKSSGKNEGETDPNSVISQTKQECLANEETVKSSETATGSEATKTSSAPGQTMKSDFSQAFSLFSKYFREKGNANAVMGQAENFNLGKPLEQQTNEDVKGSKPAKDDVSTQLGLFPQQTGFGPLRPILGTDHKIVAPTASQPWPFRGLQASNSPAMRSIVTSTTTQTVKPPTAQLTIFYAGMVSVYDDMPADKAQAIMLLADSGNPSNHKFVKAANFGQQTPATTPPSTPLGSVTRTPVSLQIITGTTDVPVPAMPSPGGPNQNQTVRKLQADLPIARKNSLQRFLEKRKDRLITKAPYATTSLANKKPDVDKLPISTKSPENNCLSRSTSPLPPSSRPFSGCCNENSTSQEASPSPISAHMA